MRLLDVAGLTRHFGGLAALRDVDVHLDEGETLGMIGPNGSGKTTFVNIVTGHLAPDSGVLRLGGHDIAGVAPHRLAALGLTRTYQAVRVFAGLSVRDNLAAARLLPAGPTGPGALSADQLVEWLNLGDLLSRPAGALTLFEQRRLELAMRLVQRPRLIMLDEPVGGLALAEVREMISLLQALKAHCAIFVIEHTMRVIRELADRVVVLMAGEKIADGPPADILRDRRVVEQYLGTSHA